MRTKIAILIFLLLCFKNISAQTTIFSENMGNPSGTTLLVNNSFQNSTGTLTFSKGEQPAPADVRNTFVSSGYSEVSGGGNVYFTSSTNYTAYGFSIEGINASNYSSLSLQFGYRKELNATHATFSVDYWNGSSWNTLANSSSALFNEVATAQAGWYLSKSLSLPIDAQINGLKIRFVKSGGNAIRIDDVKLKGTEIPPTVSTTTVDSISTNSSIFGGTVSATGGSSIIDTGTVYSVTTTNSNPTINGSGVNILATVSPNSGIGSFTNVSGAVLSPNIQYSYTAYATKSTGLTAYGTVANFYTLAVTPATPSITNPTGNSLKITLGSDANSAITTYALFETTTSTYVQSNGSLGGSAVYQTAATWGSKTVTGLSPNTAYTFQVKAKNGSDIITSASSSVSMTTLAQPSIIISGTLSALNTIYGTASSFTSFSVSGINLTDNIFVTAPYGFEVSKTAGGASGYATSQTLTPSSGTVGTTTIYIRLGANTPFGNYTGNVSVSSVNDGLTQDLTTPSSSVARLDLVISGINANNKVYDGNTTATLSGTPSLTGVLSSDNGNVGLSSTAVANFNDASIGNGKAVTVSYALTGSAASNYSLTQVIGLTANITPNNTSDVILNTSSPTTTNQEMNYLDYQGTTLSSTTNSNGVMGFRLRDGGASANDADNLGTELTGITFRITNASNLRYARIFATNAPKGVPVPVPAPDANGVSIVTFTGLTDIVAQDNNDLPLNLRVTFNSNVTDNQQMQFQIISVTAKSTGSQFGTTDGGGAISPLSPTNVNRILVVADRLQFVQQPPLSLYEESNMSPAPSVLACDVYGNRDWDFYGTINITSSGTLNLSPQSSATLFGMALFTTIKHTEPGTNLFLTANYPGLISTNSNLFSINALTIPTFDLVAPICYGEPLNNLPTTSLNGITGSWSPAINNTETTNYTFTPDTGQNAALAVITISVNQFTTPTFSPIGTIVSGATINPLPTVSNNGITGSWSPALSNTATNNYVFTPDLGQCASNAYMTITIIPSDSGGGDTQPTYPTYPTGNSTEVGITEGQLSVSLSGAATYSIPIVVPPGINGIVPHVSLNYNSQNGNGTAGYGWDISGISAISRISSTKFHDGVIDAVDFDTQDRFSFDGQRLIVKSGTSGIYGADGTVYETENYSNIRITSYGVNPNGANYGPAYFKVEYADGSIAEYGSTTTRYGSTSETRTLTTWAINYWQNPQGVRISYVYAIENNTLRVINISYGNIGDPMDETYNEIQFLYKTRERPEQSYIGGQSLTNDKILDKIYVNGFGVFFRRYELIHDITSLGYQRLISVTEKTGDGSKSLNPTVFTYPTTDLGITYQSNSTSLNLTGISVQNSATLSGDFDGDGKMDFALYPNSTPSDKNKFWVFTNINGGSSNSGYGPVNIGQFEELFSSSWLNFNGKFMPMHGITAIQLIGNQLGDVSFKTYSLVPYGVSIQNNKVISFPMYNTGESVPNLNFCGYSPIKNIPKRYINGDFNGDGITDVLAIEKSTTFYKYGTCNCCDPLGNFYSTVGQSINYTGGKTYFVDLDSRLNQTTPVFLGNITITADSKILVADANGDGISDIYVFNEGIVRVYSINSSNQIVQLWSLSDTNITISTSKTILLGDYNGDGKTDFIIPKGQAYFDWYKYMCTGISFIKTTETYNGFNYATNDALNTRYLIPTDFNNDGKTDLVRVTSSRNQADTAGQIVVNCITNMNGRFDFTAANFNNYVGNSGLQADLDKFAIPIFYNSNELNRKMEVACIYNNKVHYFESKKDLNVERQINTITTGDGVKKTITYSPLVHESCPYNCFYAYTSADNTENFPNVDISTSPVFQVVVKLEEQSSTVYKKQLFSYYGATTNFEGIGFLGFRAITRTNWHNDSTPVISTVSKYDMSLRGAITSNYSAFGKISPTLDLGPDDPFITKSTSIYNMVSGSFVDPLQSNKVFRLKVTSGQSFSGLDVTNNESSILYDSYDMPIQNTTVVKEGSNTIQTTVTDLAYDNQTSGPIYYIGRVNSKTQSVAITGDTMTNQELYAYNPQNLLSQVKKKGNSTNFLTEDNIYNQFGGITQKTITAVGLQPRITYYEYDPSGRFLTKKIDVEGLETQYDYNIYSGVLNYEISPFGLKTSFEYDKWLKKTKVTDYLLKNKYYTYTSSPGKTTVTITSDDGGSSNETVDDLGRKIQSGIKNINGIWAYTDTQYDIYDKVKKVSESYFGTTPSQWSESQYDEYGRIISAVSYTGKVVTTVYDGLNTTVSDGLKSKTTLKNAIGNITQVTDNPGGVINYTYFANNNLKSSTYNGYSTTITQDGWGRKLSIDDPSAGLNSYTYNDFGETTQEVTPNGTIQYNLDNFGKLTSKTISGPLTNITITYQYDPVTKLITSEQSTDTSGNTFFKNYTYDTQKRLNTVVENDGSNQYQFEKTLQYDSFGRLDREFYNSINVSDGKSNSKWIKHTYLNGYHWQILDDATSAMLWQTDEVDASGRLITAHYGNAVGKESHTYDGYGFPATASFTTINGSYASSTPFLKLTTAFNASRGILNTRNNSMFAWDETFHYDQLDRLTEFTDAAGTQTTQNYNNTGTINTNSTGMYAYNIPNKPFQVSTVTLDGTDNINYYTARNPQEVSYNAFKCPISINEEGNERIDFDYNQSLTRAVQYYGSNDTDKLLRPFRKYYSSDGSREIKRNMVTGELDFVTYIGGDGYSAPIILKSDGNISQSYYYLHRDYLGSILAITNPSGQVVEKRLFDAWGSLIKYGNLSGVTAVPTITGSMFLDRGYTGHEHLFGVGLINMNGRLYDPKLHRFLSPDNFVQDPFNTQNYNRYGYVLNNPLMLVDYNGESFWSWWSNNWKSVVTIASSVIVTVGIVAIVVLSGGTATPLVLALAGAAGGFVGGFVGTALHGGTFGDALLSGVIGGSMGFVMGGIGGVVGSFAPPGAFAGALYGGTTQAFLGGFGSLMMGGSFSDGAIMGGAMGTIGGGFGGYFSAKAQGLNPWTGAPPTSSIASNVNHSIAGAKIAFDNSIRSQTESTTQNTIFPNDSNITDVSNNPSFGYKGNTGNTSTGLSDELPSDVLKFHGNDLRSQKPTWGYKLFDKTTGEFMKNGITSKPLPELRYTKGFMQGYYMESTLFPTRLDAYQWEYLENLTQRGPWNYNMH